MCNVSDNNTHKTFVIMTPYVEKQKSVKPMCSFHKNKYRCLTNGKILTFHAHKKSIFFLPQYLISKDVEMIIAQIHAIIQ